MQFLTQHFNSLLRITDYSYQTIFSCYFIKSANEREYRAVCRKTLLPARENVVLLPVNQRIIFINAILQSVNMFSLPSDPNYLAGWRIPLIFAFVNG